MAAHSQHHQGGHSNSILSSDDSFRLVSETRKQAESVAASAREAIQSVYTDPALLANFIEQHDTPVFVLRGAGLAHFVLWVLGFEPGFIPPESGKCYQTLCRMLSGLPGLAVSRGGTSQAGNSMEHGVFVLTQPLFTVGYMSHQLHHWLAFRSGLQGYSERSRRLYKQFWHRNKGMIGKEVYKMDAEDIVALRAAIHRDLEALQFLRNLASEVLIPAKQAKRLASGHTSA